MNKRESFKSSLGFILVSAGCAIGIGNVWKFPYVAGLNGGGVFVLFYFLFLLLMGVPVLTMELAVGRAGKKGPVGAFKALEKPGHKWHIHGWVGTIGCLLLMMYYTTVSGWMFGYFCKFLGGSFADVTTSAQVNGIFDSMLANPWEMLLWMGIAVAVGTVVCCFSLQKGVERVSKIMMIGLLLLIVVLAINSLTLSGAGEGLAFYLLPDFGRAWDEGLFNVIVAAMNQAFFTLSIGIGSMEIFGSYMSRKNTLAKESVRICVLDTFVAVMSGLIIFPACFSYDVAPNAGPPLIFQTLPNVFVHMPGGQIWGTLFFLFMTFASFSTVIAVFQNLVATLEENSKFSKVKSSLIVGAVVLVGSIPCVLGHNVWKDFLFFGKMGVLDFEDFIVSNVLLPLGALVYLLFCSTRWGWGFDKYLQETNKGDGWRLPRGMKYYFQFVIPVLILVIFGAGIYNIFAG